MFIDSSRVAHGWRRCQLEPNPFLGSLPLHASSSGGHAHGFSVQNPAFGISSLLHNNHMLFYDRKIENLQSESQTVPGNVGSTARPLRDKRTLSPTIDSPLDSALGYHASLCYKVTSPLPGPCRRPMLSAVHCWFCVFTKRMGRCRSINEVMMIDRPWNVAFSRRDWYFFIAIAASFAVLMARNLFDTSLGYPDADRILMDGVLFRDFLVDLPFSDPYGYVKHYFAQYPALSLGYRPPFFPFFEGLSNLLFGVNMWSSRIVLIGFGVIGLTAFFATVRRMYGGATALAATALLASTPFLVRLSWYTLGEIPVLSMALVTLFFYARYVAEGRSLDLWATALVAALAVWTKQTAVFLLLWMFLHQLSIGTLLKQLRQPRVLAATAAVILVLIPLAIITVWLGDQNIRQSIGALPSMTQPAYADTGLAQHIGERLQTDVLLSHLRQIITHHLSLPAIGLVIVGLLWALWFRDFRAWFWLSFILVVYVFFTYIKGQNARYPIFWIPAFLVFASVPLAYLTRTAGYWFRGYSGLIMLVVGWQLIAIWLLTPRFATGYDQAAAYVLEHSESPTVFFDGYNNGYFIYFMRALDPERSMYVLRGDKLLSSTSIAGKNQLEVHAQDTDDINDILDQFGPQFIIVEDLNTIRIPIHDVLRSMLANDSRYRLVQTIPVDTGEPSTRPPLAGVSLLIYEKLDHKPPRDGILRLRLPVVGQTLEVPLRDLGARAPTAAESTPSSPPP
jgi:hypothetical protein